MNRAAIASLQVQVDVFYIPQCLRAVPSAIQHLVVACVSDHSLRCECHPMKRTTTTALRSSICKAWPKLTRCMFLCHAQNGRPHGRHHIALVQAHRGCLQYENGHTGSCPRLCRLPQNLSTHRQVVHIFAAASLRHAPPLALSGL